MNKLAALLALLLWPALALGQTGAYSGHTFVGGVPATTSGMNSSNYMDGIIPGASVTVYLTGTSTKATIYADGSNTPLSNPFFSNLAKGTNPGGFIFWSLQNQGLDIQAQGGMGNASCTTSPLCYSTATMLQKDVYPNNSFSPLPGLNCTGTGASQVCTFPGTATALSGTFGGPVINVGYYGASSTATAAQNSAAFASAVTAANAPGSTLYLPAQPGIYYLASTLSLPCGMSLVGDGWNSVLGYGTAIRIASGTDATTLSYGGSSSSAYCKGGVLRDLGIYGNSGQSSTVFTIQYTEFLRTFNLFIGGNNSDGECLDISQSWDSYFYGTYVQNCSWVETNSSTGTPVVHVVAGTSTDSNNLFFYGLDIESFGGRGFVADIAAGTPGGISPNQLIFNGLKVTTTGMGPGHTGPFAHGRAIDFEGAGNVLCNYCWASVQDFAGDTPDATVRVNNTTGLYGHINIGQTAGSTGYPSIGFGYMTNTDMSSFTSYIVPGLKQSALVASSATPTGTLGSAGSMTATTICAEVSAIDSSGYETPVSPESTVCPVVDGVTNTSIGWAWTAVASASSYRVYVGSTGAENSYYTSNTNSYTQTTNAGTAGSPQPSAIWNTSSDKNVSIPCGIQAFQQWTQTPCTSVNYNIINPYIPLAAENAEFFTASTSANVLGGDTFINYCPACSSANANTAWSAWNIGASGNISFNLHGDTYSNTNPVFRITRSGYTPTLFTFYPQVVMPGGLNVASSAVIGGGDLVCAEAADSTIGALTPTAGSSTSSSMTYTVSAVPAYIYAGTVIQGQGNTPSGYNAGPFTVTAVTGTTITVSSTNNPGTMTGYGTISLYCSNQSTDALTTSVQKFAVNTYTVPANYFAVAANLNIQSSLKLFAPSTSENVTLELWKGNSTVLYTSGSIPPTASITNSAGSMRFSLIGLGAELVDAELSSLPVLQTSVVGSTLNNKTSQPLTVSGTSQAIALYAGYTATGVVSATYVSGGTFTNTSGSTQTCTLGAFNNSSTATGTLTLNTSAVVTGITITARGAAATAAPTSIAQTNSCTGGATWAAGAITITSVLGGSPGNAILQTALVPTQY